MAALKYGRAFSALGWPQQRRIKKNEIWYIPIDGVGNWNLKDTHRSFLLSALMSERKASCIVLGGGGFLGTNLCRRLVADGHRVRAFGRRCSFSDALEGVEWFQGDFADAAALAAAI